jgi:hypothetical protein
MKLPPIPEILAAGIYGLTPVQVGALVSAAALIFSIRRWRMNVLRKQKQKSREVIASPRGGTTERTMASSGLNVRDVTSQIQALLADLEETSRRVAAQIDNRRSRLEQLIADADEKIRRLEALTQAGGGVPTGNAGVVREATQTLSRLRQERGAPPANEDPAYAPIYQLADQGKSAREIGQSLGRQPGEIELILALRGRQRV